MRNAGELREQWLAMFAKERTSEEWADFCVGMSRDALARAFASAMRQSGEAAGTDPGGASVEAHKTKGLIK